MLLACSAYGRRFMLASADLHCEVSACHCLTNNNDDDIDAVAADDDAQRCRYVLEYHVFHWRNKKKASAKEEGLEGRIRRAFEETCVGN
jgi:hypothetical protein